MDLDKIIVNVGEELGLEIRLTLGRSVKRGGALADVQLELDELAEKVEETGVVSKREFYDAFLDAHSKSISK